MKAVDVHAHLAVPAAEQLVAGEPGAQAQREDQARHTGAESSRVMAEVMKAVRPKLLDVSARLASMDAARVDVQVVSPSPGHFHYWADAALARTLCEQVNRAIAEHVAKAPDRLRGLGQVPLQHPDLAVEMLDHAVGECGLLGVQISSHARGPDAAVHELSNPALDALWARAAELGATIFIHPLGCTLGERLDQWYLSNIVGQPLEHAVALSHLIFSGVLDRHPALKIVAAHGGGYLPGYIGRSDHGWTVRPEARVCRDLPSSYLPRLWYDSLVYTPSALRALVAIVGPERVVVGSDYPFDMGVDDPVARVEQAGLEPSAIAGILGGNVADAFPLGAPF